MRCFKQGGSAYDIALSCDCAHVAPPNWGRLLALLACLEASLIRLHQNRLHQMPTFRSWLHAMQPASESQCDSCSDVMCTVRPNVLHCRLPVTEAPVASAESPLYVHDPTVALRAELELMPRRTTPTYKKRIVMLRMVPWPGISTGK